MIIYLTTNLLADPLEVQKSNFQFFSNLEILWLVTVWWDKEPSLLRLELATFKSPAWYAIHDTTIYHMYSHQGFSFRFEEALIDGKGILGGLDWALVQNAALVIDIKVISGFVT